MTNKLPNPVRTATSLVADSGLEGDAGDVVEHIHEVAEALQASHTTGYRKAVLRIIATTEMPGMTLDLLRQALAEEVDN